jgi:hypothetical protein
MKGRRSFSKAGSWEWIMKVVFISPQNSVKCSKTKFDLVQKLISTFSSRMFHQPVICGTPLQLKCPFIRDFQYYRLWRQCSREPGPWTNAKRHAIKSSEMHSIHPGYLALVKTPWSSSWFNFGMDQHASPCSVHGISSCFCVGSRSWFMHWLASLMCCEQCERLTELIPCENLIILNVIYAHL